MHLDFKSSQLWLFEHRELVDKWLDENRDLEDHVDMWSIFLREPVQSVMLIQDYFKDNDEKIDQLIDFAVNSSYYVALICGNAGSGKSSLLHFFGKAIKQKYPNVKIYYYEEINCPEWSDGPIWSINEAHDCFIFFNEMAKAFPARDSQTEDNKQVSQNLLDNRHYGVKFFGCNIRLSMVDINLVRSCNMFFYKYITPEVIYLDRKELITPLLKRMLPSNPDDKSAVLAVSDGFYITFSYPLSGDFTKALSMSRLLTQEQKEQVAKQKFYEFDDVKLLRKYMLLRFRFNKPIEWYKELEKTLV